MQATKSRSQESAKSKLDLYVAYKPEYATPNEPTLMDVSPARYLAISGTGKPGGDEFQDKLAALYNVAYTIKMAQKAAGSDYKVAGLEGLWSADMRWTLVIRIPDQVGEREISSAREKLRGKGKSSLVAEVELLRLEEGKCLQMLHIGPYDKVGTTIARLHASAKERGMEPAQRCHEIYLSDPRRVASEKLRTIVRQPVRPI